MKTILKILTVFLLVLGTQSCKDDDNTTPNPPQELNIVETAQQNSQLTTLVAALQAADGDLVNVLSGNGPFTVLAPTNAAFNTFLDENGFNSLDDVPTDVLSQILLNHVVSDELNSSALITLGAGYTTTNAEGPGGSNLSLYFNTETGVSFNGVSDVTTPDVMASNGVIHIVDAVIALPNIVTFATADSNFSTLVAALTRDDQLAEEFVATLSTENGDDAGITPFTVFAPVNSAFQALLDSRNEWSSLEDIEGTLLTSVLQHHVITGANARAEGLTDGMMVTTLEGDMLTVNLPGNDGNPARLTDGSGTTDIDVVVVNVQATNGVIHAIESVLVPDTEN